MSPVRDARAPVRAAPSRREAKKALHRRKILETARAVFFRDGFVDTNLDEIARGAGVAKGTLYRYFDSKADLYVAVLAHNGEIFAEKMRGARAGAADAADQIRRIARFYFEHWTANEDYFEIFWAMENQEIIGELTPAAVRQVTGLWRECLRILAETIEAGVREGTFARCDAWEVANIFWTVANGLIRSEHVAARRRLRRSRLDRIFDDAIELLLRGISVARPAP
jgi:TetR/AcrR family fatty acid metabolism transcriptional regulator